MRNNMNFMGHGPGMGGRGFGGMGHGPGHMGPGPMHRGPGHMGPGPMHRGPRPHPPIFFGPVFRPRPRFHRYGYSSFGCLGPFLLLILLGSLLGFRF